jgi:hypothetical protein
MKPMAFEQLLLPSWYLSLWKSSESQPIEEQLPFCFSFERPGMEPCCSNLGDSSLFSDLQIKDRFESAAFPGVKCVLEGGPVITQGVGAADHRFQHACAFLEEVQG